jgi:hypothetical protein
MEVIDPVRAILSGQSREKVLLWFSCWSI